MSRPNPSRRLAVVALLTAASVSWSVFATGNLEVITQGGNAIGNRLWHNNSIPLTWRYHDPTTLPACSYSSTGAPPASLQPAGQAGFNAWETDPYSRIDFTYGGTTTVANIGADGVNVLTFCDSAVLSSNPGFLASTPSTALTTTTTVTAGGGCPPGQGLLDVNGPPPPAGFCFPAGTYPPGTTVDADIRFNTFSSFEQDNFTTVGTAGLFDIQATATHEVGHFFGLSHDPLLHAVMFPFIDDEPPSDGLGQRVLKLTDLSTSRRYYPEPAFFTDFGGITGFVTLDGAAGDGVHVVAVDPNNRVGAIGRFSLSLFEDAAALGPDGPDFAANGAGFYRLDGLPPGNYHVYTEYFDNSEFITTRLANRYNATVGNSSVSNGSSTAMGQNSTVWLGFLPELAEFHDAGESGDGGDGVNPGVAADNSDRAALVPVSAGATTSSVNVDINIEPPNLQSSSQRENPTTRTVVPNDLLQGSDVITAFILNGGNDDFYAIRYTAGVLPAPPYNVAEGLWGRGGRSDQNYVVRLTYSDSMDPNRPAFNDPIVPSAGRVITGGSGGLTAAGDFTDIRDQWNVTINEPRDVWIVMNQPPSPPGTGLLTSGYFILVARTAGNSARVNRTQVSQNGGASWGLLTADVLYDLIVEADPPVLVTGAVPNNLDEGTTADVDVTGAGFRSGAAVSFGPNITVNTVTFMSPTLLRCNVTLAVTGGTAPRPVNVTVTNPGVVFPNVARVFTANPVLDGDGDGEPDGTDCAPGDASLRRPATEVQNLDVADLGGSSRVSWDSQDAVSGSGTVYDVVTGLIGNLAATGDYAAAVCAVNDHADSPFVDLNADPPPGDARYWLARAFNACSPGPGTYGDSSVTPDPRDALDAGVPCP